MGAIEDILKSKKKQKETVELLCKELKRDSRLIANLMQCFEIGNASQRGSCMEAIEYVTKEEPEFAENCLDFVIDHIDDDAPRVRWEAARIIGNVASTFPEKIKSAVPKLLENATDKGTVVRWSAAFALTEIAKNNKNLKKELEERFNEIVKKESNNGVKKIYLKYLKAAGV